MNEEIKKDNLNEEILDDDTLEQVAGGSQAEIDSDLAAYAKMIGKNSKDVNMTKLMKAFAKGGVSVTFNGDRDENIYEVDGSRVSRYDALVLLARGCGKSTFDPRPYMGASEYWNGSWNP